MLLGLGSISILDIGNTMQITGVVISNKDRNYLAILPGESAEKLAELPVSFMPLDSSDWEKILHQSDVLNVETVIGEKKAVVRKSQRQVDVAVSWKVFERDGYRCRYCARRGPLTVDHVICWEAGGATVEANLVAACKPCNRTRGNVLYAEWLRSDEYRKASGMLSPADQQRNFDLITELEDLAQIRQAKRSR